MAISGKLLLIIGVVCWASLGMASGGVGGADEIGSPPSAPGSPEALRKGCTDDDQCGPNHFCNGKGTIKRCYECTNCALRQRKPKPSTYEGATCATHHDECGDCFDGYEFRGGICIPISTTSKTTTSTDAPNGPNVEASVSREAGRELEERQDATTGWVTLVIAVIIVICIGISALVMWFTTTGCRALMKLGGRKSEEEANLTGNGFNDSPSAPPPELEEEYQNPPPVAPNSGIPFQSRNEKNILRRPILPKRVSFKKQQANPFNAGNGAGDWEEIDETSNAAASTPDQVDDGAGPSSSRGGGLPRVAYAEMDTGANREQPSRVLSPIHAEGEIRSGGPERRGRTVSSRARRNSNPQPRSRATAQMQVRPEGPGFGSMVGQMEVDPPMSLYQPRPRTPDNQGGNLRLAVMDVWVRAGVWFRDGQPDSDPTAPGNQDMPTPLASSTPQRFVVSAPPSPREPNRIDDTSLVPLTELRGTFERSRMSLDSGTGTNDADRSMPSRSTSGNDVGRAELSDMDSMYDDEAPSPGSPYTAPADESPATVPELDGHQAPARQRNY